MNKIVIVGMSEAGRAALAPAVLNSILKADLLAGGKRLIAMWPDVPAEKIAIAGNLEELAERIRADRDKNIVVLASGDPGFYGIAKFLVQRFGKNDVEIHPNVSSVQLAFARIKESWEDATFFSVHGRPLEDVIPAVRASRKIAILTDNHNSPAQVARLLLSGGLRDCTAYLCENLGSGEERVTQMDLDTLAGTEAAPLSLLVLTRQDGTNPGKWSLPY
ncbi:MAG: precorrin-6y C5,15-methyltransferase (decarboxylating) subunit CbiE, partial [Chloroflexi bacterium]|nr:precorrin-6y C5,15-methyltransferase (decarboxylating) subunit CbiE [Chloroflexota bacterium]